MPGMNYMAPVEAVRCKLCRKPAQRLYQLDDSGGPFDLLQCEDCGFHFIDYLDPEGVEACGPVHDLAHNRERIARNLDLLERFSPPPGRVLDVGCGAGDFLASLWGYKAQGVEPDARYRQIALGRGHTVSAETPAERFNAVTLWDVIEHVNDPRSVAAQCAAALGPGGVLLLDTPNREGLFYRFGEFTARLTRGRFPTLLNVQYSPAPFCHKQIFRECDIRALLAEAGFGRVIVRRRCELSFPTEFYTQRLVKPAWLRRLLDPLFAALVRALPIYNKLIVVAFKKA